MIAALDRTGKAVSVFAADRLARARQEGKAHLACAIGHELRADRALFTPMFALVQPLLGANRDLRLERRLAFSFAYSANDLVSQHGHGAVGIDVASKTAIRPGDLDEAEALSERLTRAYSARNRPSEAMTRAADDRARAYTLVLGAYDQARRAVWFLRWSEGDVEAIAPSLWKGRGKRRAPRAAAETASEAPLSTEAGE